MRGWNRKELALWSITVAAAGGCTGVIGDPTAGIGGDSPGDVLPTASAIQFRCDPDERAPGLPLPRLTRAQLEASLEVLIQESLPQAEATGVLSELAAALGTYPDDEVTVTTGSHGGVRRAGQALQAEHVSAMLAIAAALGTALTRTPERLEALLGPCGVDADASNDAACLRTFIQRFGRIAERAPLSAEDVGFYESVYDSEGIDPVALADVIATLAASPKLQYVVEHGEGSLEDGSVLLDAQELAVRLALQLWDAPPDAELRALADEGTLLEDEVYRAQVRRMLDAPRAALATRRFYEEWFWLTDPPSLAALKGDAIFDAVRGDFDPGPNLHLEMRDEVLDMAAYYTLDVAGGIADLFGSDRSFARSPQVAEVYGVAPWDGDSEPPVFANPARRGLLTRAAFVVGNSNITHPILKGVQARIGLLCDHVPDPPASAMENLPTLEPHLTARERAEELTEVPRSACVQCHTVINPIGMLSENFDTLGRFRSVEPVYASDGALLVERPVDTAAIPRFRENDGTEYEDAATATEALIASGKPAACFARTYLRFSFGRAEDETGDGCVLQEVNEVLQSGGSLRSAIEAFVLSQRFRERVFDGPVDGV